MTNTIGIDLGTTYSVMSAVDGEGVPFIIKNAEGKTTTPSVIYFGGGEPIVGEEAKEQQAFGSAEVAAFFKRSMGDQHFGFEWNGTYYSPVQLSALVLKKLKKDAEAELGVPVSNAVITVPAYFDNAQREDTIKAGKLAGLTVTSIINEPTAAAIAYGFKEGTGRKNLLIYDLGGGTFDVTVAKVTDYSVEVLSTNGDHLLGGKDWDDRLVMHVSEKFLSEHGIDPLEDVEFLNEILVHCEHAKRALTDLQKTGIQAVHSGKRSSFELTRGQFEEMTDDLLYRTWNLSDIAIREAKLSWDQIDDVILAGGSSKMPMISSFIEKQYGKKPLKGLNVDEVVAYGAAIKAAMDQEKAAQKPLLKLGSAKKVTDVMSHSLGMVAIRDDYSAYFNSRIIEKNKPIPASVTRPYQLQTASGEDGQLEIYVTQGESEIPSESTVIGKYTVDGIPSSNGLADVHVNYAYDGNGVVQVTASDRFGTLLEVVKTEVPSDLSWLNEAPVKEEEKMVPMSVVIAVDLSGSMNGNPLLQAKEAAQTFVKQLDLSRSRVSIMGFANKTKTLLPLCGNETDLLWGIDRLSDLYHEGKIGYGNSAEPFTEALYTLEHEEGIKFIIVLTDGHWSYPKEAINRARICRDAEADIVAIGFGSADWKFLKEIATSDENALFTDVTKLQSSFSKIAQELNGIKQKQKSRSLLLR